MSLQLKSLKLLWLIHNITGILCGEREDTGNLHLWWIRAEWRGTKTVMSFIRDLPTHSLSKLDSTRRFLLFCHITKFRQKFRLKPKIVLCFRFLLDRNRKHRNWFRFPFKGKGISAERKISAENFGFLCSLLKRGSI